MLFHLILKSSPATRIPTLSVLITLIWGMFSPAASQFGNAAEYIKQQNTVVYYWSVPSRYYEQKDTTFMTICINNISSGTRNYIMLRSNSFVSDIDRDGYDYYKNYFYYVPLREEAGSMLTMYTPSLTLINYNQAGKYPAESENDQKSIEDKIFEYSDKLNHLAILNDKYKYYAPLEELGYALGGYSLAALFFFLPKSNSRDKSGEVLGISMGALSTAMVYDAIVSIFKKKRDDKRAKILGIELQKQWDESDSLSSIKNKESSCK